MKVSDRRSRPPGNRADGVRTATFVTHKLVRTDGQGRVNAEVAAALAVRGWHVDAVSSEIGKDLASLPGVTWHAVVVPPWIPSTLIRYQIFGFLIGRLLGRMDRADILQLNGAIAYGVASDVNVANFVHAHWARSPYHPARTVRGPMRLYRYLFTRANMAWERRAFGRSRHVVAVSDQVRDALIQYVGVDPDRIEVIPPGVDDRQFRPLRPGEVNKLRAEIGAAPDAFVLLFVGDVQSNRKNLDLVLQAMPRLPDRVHLAVIGGDKRSPYPAVAKRLGVDRRTHFLGTRTTDMPELMRGADAFVLPSHYDPFALVVTEAMASGVPPITVPMVGASALIHDGENGFVLPDGATVEPLVSTVAYLADNPDRRAAIGRAARVTAEGHSWDTMAGRYEELYARILAERPGAAAVAVHA